MRPKLIRMQRASRPASPRQRPRMLAVAGDSAAGKTTLVAGIVEALGRERCTSICVDDYHRYDREERRNLPFTPLHPACNHIAIMEQHLQLLADGQPILKPVYDHREGTLTRPEVIEPRDFVIVEGSYLCRRISAGRASMSRSTSTLPSRSVASGRCDGTPANGDTRDQVLAELNRREPESAAFIRPQREHADIVVQFAPIQGRPDSPGTPLSATLLLRPTIPHPPLSQVLDETHRWTVHLTLVRDEMAVQLKPCTSMAMPTARTPESWRS